MITNYPEFFCAVAASLDAGSGTRYYSNVNPSREWTGEETVEFAEDEPSVQWFLSGRYQKTRKLVAYSRSETESRALTLVKNLRPLVLRETLDRLRENGEIYCYSIEDIGTTADVRGYSVGETFYGYINFTLTERIELN